MKCRLSLARHYPVITRMSLRAERGNRFLGGFFVLKAEFLQDLAQFGRIR